MTHFGIIGYPLEHSFSALIFNERFAAEHMDAEYSLYPIKEISDFPSLLQQMRFRGLNVTMPYKQSIIPFLDGLDETAQAVGAVNVLDFRAGRIIGYNTDILGFERSLRGLLRPSDEQALVLGSGGASKAVCAGLTRLGIRPTIVSRDSNKGLTYAELTADIVTNHSIIVNTTPLGMHPNSDSKPDIPYAMLRATHLLYDVIYNPEETLFLQEGKRRGCRICNGREMLIGQAEAAWEIWNRD